MTTVIDLGKLRFYWAGGYDITTQYELNDVVRYGGNVYVYINVAKTVGNEPTDPVYWGLMVEGINFIGEWSPTVQYFIGDGVAYGSTVYVSLEDNINKRPDLFPAVWSQFVEGIQFEGVYSPTITYQANDVVSYGPSAYIAKQTTNNNLPTNTTYWDSFVQGISPEGVYNNATAYVPNEIVAYGANLYVAKANTTGNIPTNTTFWDLFVDTIRTRGNWGTATVYFINDIVVYGGNTYIALIQATSGVFATDLAAGRWQIFNSGVRWRGQWATSTPYLVNDIVRQVGSSYIATEDFTSGSNFNTEFTAGKWVFFAQGGDDVLPVVSPGDEGYSLTVNPDGASLSWLNASGSNNVFFVSPDGLDTNPGTSLALPFASIKAACAAVPANQMSTIFVKTGTYLQTQLPIIVPPSTAIVGDNQRTVIVSPAPGLAADGVTPNNQATMFLMSNASVLNRMTFTGMTGWVEGSVPEDISTSTPKGVVVALNPASPVSTKSPYILECSATGVGCVGALVDGSVQASGNKSMLFHAYTVITDNGVGFWMKDGGRAEIVSCFTYFAYFGYAASGGGIIRSLNGNNSYGTWGAASFGFLASETPHTGTLFGKQLTVTADPITVGFAPGATVTGVTSGATGVITNLQASAAKIYYNQTSGTPFQNGEDISDGTNILTLTGDGVSDQKGFLLVGNNFSSAPLPGASIQVAGDTSAYVVQAVSGSFVDATSVLSIALVQEKATPSPSGSALSIRYDYSQIRLTGHDFLSVGTGGIATTNYPDTPLQPPIPGNEVDEDLPGRVYYVTTDQDGNFRVGQYFRIDQGTGRATLNANAFDLSGLTSLRLGSIGAQLGEQINEFSADPTLGGANPTNVAVPTEFAVKTYVDTRVPQAMPTSVGNTGRALFSTGSGLAFQTLEALPEQTYGNGEILFTDGTAPYWDNFTQITGQNTFSFVNGASFPTTTYTAISLVNASPTFTYSATFASLPPGITNISVNSSGVLTMDGTFTTNGSYNLTVNATDNRGVIGRLHIRVVVAATNVIPVFTTAASTVTFTLPPGAAATVTNFQATNTGGGIVYAISGGYPSWLTLNTSTGALTGTAPDISVPTQTYNLTMSATAGGVTVLKTFRWTLTLALPQGQALFGLNTGVGDFTWVAPAGVTSVSVVAVGSGSWGSWQWAGGGSGGGGLGWRNNIPVVPGTSYTVRVANWGSNNGSSGSNSNSSHSFFISEATVCGFSSNATSGGSFTAPGGGGGSGGAGGSWPNGGGGAAGYTGSGSNGGSNTLPGAGGGGSGAFTGFSSTWGFGGGGGVGLLGQGPSATGWNPTTVPGAGGGGGSGGGAGIWGETQSFGNNSARGGDYGGGGGGGGTSTSNNSPFTFQSRGGQGGVRIIWGSNRAFPSTNTADVTPT